MVDNEKVNSEEKEVIVNKIVKDIEKLFTQGEVHLSSTTQKKPLFNFLPHTIVVTNKRIIRHTPHMFGSRFIDKLWRDLHNVHLQENLFGAHLTFQFTNGEVLAINYLPKDHAKEVYRIAQEREEEWLVKRKEWDLKQKRAESGASHIVVGGSDNEYSENSNNSNLKTKLKELKELREDDLITEDEYAKKKAELLK